MATMLNIPLDEEEIKKNITAVARERALNVTGQLIRQSFADGSFNGTKGVAFSLIEKMVDDHILSDEGQATIKRMIETKLDKAFEDAVKTAMAHRANKFAFSPEFSKHEPKIIYSKCL